MADKASTTKFVVPWAFIFSFILLVLKVTAFPTISWWIVALPMLLVFGIMVAVTVLALVVGFLVYLFGDK